MNERDQKRARTRKISIDLPMELWIHFERNVQPHGYKIKEYILGAFEALKFLDTFLAEHLTEKQLLAVSPLIMQEIEKIEKIYVNLDAPLKKVLKKHHVHTTIPSDIVSRFKELDMNHTSHLLREIMESSLPEEENATTREDTSKEKETRQESMDPDTMKRKILELLND